MDSINIATFKGKLGKKVKIAQTLLVKIVYFIDNTVTTE